MNNLAINWYGIRGIYLGWQLFGVFHFLMIVAATAFAFWNWKFATPKTQSKLGFLAIFLFFFRYLYFWGTGNLTAKSSIPLHLCDLSLILGGIALALRINWLQRIVVFWSFLPVLFVILFPEITRIENVLSYPILNFWLTHILTFGTVFGIVKFNKINIKDYFWATGSFLGLLVLAFLINQNLDSNYMFLTNNPMILSSFESIWFIKPLIILIFLILFYAEFWLFQKLFDLKNPKLSKIQK